MKLGYFNEGSYYLTANGKIELVYEASRGNVGLENKKYNDDNFTAILEFIVKNFDNTINAALVENVSSNLISTDRHSKIAQNRRKLETYFEAVASFCERDDLTGDNILSYFCSEEYQKGINEQGLVSTIREMDKALRKNIVLENKKFLRSIKGKCISLKK